mgnify:CR=1 FL=1
MFDKTGLRKSALAVRHLRHAVLLLLFGLGIATARAEISVTDDAGHRIVLSRPAQRIISLAPHVTELVYAAGAGEKLVGVVEYSDYPETAKRLPHIGSHAAFDPERIAALRPDLAIAWGSGNPPSQLAQLRRVKIPVQLGRRPLEPANGNLLGFYQRLLAAVDTPVVTSHAEVLEAGKLIVPRMLALLSGLLRRWDEAA